jgi:adenylyltransferase/sulfurtransferase
MATATAPLATQLEELSSDEILRYSRHLILPEVALEGQQRLKASRVLLIGAGGLGSPLALYLAAAGVGTIGLVDFDVVDVTNLQRQIVHGSKDVGRPKLESARDRLKDMNPHVHVEGYETRLTSENALEIVRDYDIVIDGTDNFATRYLTNDACVILGKPNVYGSIYRFEGQSSVFATEDGPCYRCLYPEPPPPGLVPSCAEGGVLGVLPGLVGTIQATEGIKLLLGIGEPLIGRLLLIDALSMQFRTMRLRKNPQCPACGTREIRELIDYDQFCGIGGDPLQDPHPGGAGGEAAAARRLRPDRRARAARVGDREDPGRASRAARHVHGVALLVRQRARHRGDVQDGRSQRQGGAAAPGGGVQESVEPCRRHPPVERRRRSVGAEVLNCSGGWRVGSSEFAVHGFLDASLTQ